MSCLYILVFNLPVFAAAYKSGVLFQVWRYTWMVVRSRRLVSDAKVKARVMETEPLPHQSGNFFPKQMCLKHLLLHLRQREHVCNRLLSHPPPPNLVLWLQSSQLKRIKVKHLRLMRSQPTRTRPVRSQIRKHQRTVKVWRIDRRPSFFFCFMFATTVWICWLQLASWFNMFPQSFLLFFVFSRASVQVQLRRAAKARIIRMVRPKAKRHDLEVPQWVKDEWAKGNKNLIADLLCSANFEKDWQFFPTRSFVDPYYPRCCRTHEGRLFMCMHTIYSIMCRLPLQEEFFNRLHIVVTKKKKVELVVEESWNSEEDMKELGWSQPFDQQ